MSAISYQRCHWEEIIHSIGFNHMLVRLTLVFVLPLLIAVGIGCATTTQARRVTPSGFLGDYSPLTPGEGEQALLRFLKSGADFAKLRQRHHRSGGHLCGRSGWRVPGLNAGRPLAHGQLPAHGGCQCVIGRLPHRERAGSLRALMPLWAVSQPNASLLIR